LARLRRTELRRFGAAILHSGCAFGAARRPARQRLAADCRCVAHAIQEIALKKYLLTLLAAVAAVCAAPAWSAVDVGVGITIQQPGVYGRIEIGGQPPPPVMYPQPVIIARPAVVVQQPPLYLYVPPGHAKDWRKHCGQYNACSRQVYFVQEDWVRERYDEHNKHEHDKGHGKSQGKSKKYEN
jgi:hypothetical protein